MTIVVALWLGWIAVIDSETKWTKLEIRCLCQCRDELMQSVSRRSTIIVIIVGHEFHKAFPFASTKRRSRQVYKCRSTSKKQSLTTKWVPRSSQEARHDYYDCLCPVHCSRSSLDDACLLMMLRCMFCHCYNRGASMYEH